MFSKGRLDLGFFGIHIHRRSTADIMSRCILLLYLIFSEDVRLDGQSPARDGWQKSTRDMQDGDEQQRSKKHHGIEEKVSRNVCSSVIESPSVFVEHLRNVNILEDCTRTPHVDFPCDVTNDVTMSHCQGHSYH